MCFILFYYSSLILSQYLELKFQHVTCTMCWAPCQTPHKKQKPEHHSFGRAQNQIFELFLRHLWSIVWLCSLLLWVLCTSNVLYGHTEMDGLFHPCGPSLISCLGPLIFFLIHGTLFVSLSYSTYTQGFFLLYSCNGGAWVYWKPYFLNCLILPSK